MHSRSLSFILKPRPYFVPLASAVIYLSLTDQLNYCSRHFIENRRLACGEEKKTGKLLSSTICLPPRMKPWKGNRTRKLFSSKTHGRMGLFFHLISRIQQIVNIRGYNHTLTDLSKGAAVFFSGVNRCNLLDEHAV